MLLGGSTRLCGVSTAGDEEKFPANRRAESMPLVRIHPLDDAAKRFGVVTKRLGQVPYVFRKVTSRRSILARWLLGGGDGDHGAPWDGPRCREGLLAIWPSRIASVGTALTSWRLSCRPRRRCCRT